MVLIRRVLGVALFVGLLVLGWQFANSNSDPVSVHHPMGATEPRAVWLVVLAAWASGLVMASLYLGFSILRQRIEIRRLRKSVRDLEKELRGFRNEPIGPIDPGPSPTRPSQTGQPPLSVPSHPAALGSRGGS